MSIWKGFNYTDWDEEPKEKPRLPNWFVAILAIFLIPFFVWMIIYFNQPGHEFGVAPTPEGYTKVGEDISYKCDQGIILWYDNYQRKSLPATPNDGRGPR
jgi:hypothetical protein